MIFSIFISCLHNTGSLNSICWLFDRPVSRSFFFTHGMNIRSVSLTIREERKNWKWNTCSQVIYRSLRNKERVSENIRKQRWKPSAIVSKRVRKQLLFDPKFNHNLSTDYFLSHNTNNKKTKQVSFVYSFSETTAKEKNWRRKK